MCPLFSGYCQQWKYNKEQNRLSSQSLYYSKGRDGRRSRHIWKCCGKKTKPVKPCMRRGWAWYSLQDGHRGPHWEHDLWKTGLEESEGPSHMIIWGNTVSPRNNSKYKVSRVRVWLTCLRKRLTCAWSRIKEGQRSGRGSQKGTEDCHWGEKTQAFTPNEMG